MKIAHETSVRFVVRPLAGVHTTPTARRGSVLYVVGSRSDAVRLAPVIMALRSAYAPQLIASVASDDDRVAPPEVIDAAGLPLTRGLVDPSTGSPSERTARTLAAFERMLLEEQPRLVVIAGDADATLACGLAASKLGIQIARVGGGLRCHDWSLSEEINRALVDRLADILLVDSQEAADELESEGIDGAKIHCVGSTVVDSVMRWVHVAEKRRVAHQLGLSRSNYVLATLHRPENVELDQRLLAIVDSLEALARKVPVVFPIHPRTAAVMSSMGDVQRLRDAGVTITDPLDYLDFLSLHRDAGAVLTDSGCVQEEASALGVRCYTLRRATERGATLRHGTNILLGDNPSDITAVRCGTPQNPSAIPFWDGRAGERGAAVLSSSLELTTAA
jgi:UDP-N-acetylglucosamine 2-epimerase (non-hydrolysing)